MKIIKLLFLVFSFYPLITKAQKHEIAVEVFIEKLHYSALGSSSNEVVYKFYLDSIDPSNLITDQCFSISSNEKEYTADSSNNPNIASNNKLKIFNVSSQADTLHLLMENYENDKGELCNYDKGDDDHFTTNLEVYLPGLMPGIMNGPFTIENEKFSAIVRIRLGVPQPEDIVEESGEKVYEISKPTTIKTSLDIKNKSGISYYWQYKNSQSNNWTDLLQPTTVGSITFTAKNLFNNPISKSESISFRVKAASGEINSLFSEELSLLFLPNAPILNYNEITTTPACPKSGAGSIIIKNFNNITDSIYYYLVKGRLLEQEYYPDKILDSLKIAKGKLSKSESISINNLAEGDYILVLHNVNIPVGKVFINYPFSIRQFQELVVKQTDITNTKCDTTNDGVIDIRTEGGNPAKLSCFIDPPAGKRVLDDIARKVIFSALPIGIYRVIIQDECLQAVTLKNIEIKKDPTILNGALQVIKEPINDGNEGAIKVDISGGSGLYAYTLITKDAIVKKAVTNSSTLTIDQLQKGDYRLKIKDSLRHCGSVWDTSFLLNGKIVVIPKESSFFTGSSKAANKEKTITAIDTSSAPKRPRANASFTTTDDQHYFYNTTKRTSQTKIGYKEDEIDNQGFTIVVQKSKYLMTILDSKNDTLVIYPVVFGNNDQGDKMQEGDRKTPEGVYKIIEKRAHAEWYKIMLLDFPNEKDRIEFRDYKQKGLVPQDAKIGGEIAIHGTRDNEDIEIDRMKNWTNGCIATKNIYMEQLYKYIAVGTKVIILK